MYHKHHTKGIIISSRTEGDSNKLINIFTESFGLINARAQGARNIHSKLRGGSQDFSLGEFSLIHGKTGWKVVSVRADKNLFEEFRNSQTKLKIINNILNLVNKLVGENLPTQTGEVHNSVFSIVLNFFVFLKGADDKDVALAECLTLLRILHSLGFMRHDPEFMIPMSSTEIATTDLEIIAPRRLKIIELINESLKAA